MKKSELIWKEAVDPADPDLASLERLLLDTFADPNLVLGAGRVRERLSPKDPLPDATFHVLLLKAGGAIAGASIFRYIAASNCGFSEYLVVAPDWRGVGLGRSLFARRAAMLDEQARKHGCDRCNGLFIEAENPERTPRALLEREARTAMEAIERLRLFDHLGFLRVDLPYVQPPLGAGKLAVTYLDLLFWPASSTVRTIAQIPAAWVDDTLLSLWKSWAPDAYRSLHEELSRRIGTGPVPLRPLLEKE